MLIKLPYGNKYLSAIIPDENIIGYYPVKSVIVENEYNILEKALKNPINSISFNKFLSSSNELLIITNDITRPTPTAKILEIIFPYLKGLEIKILIATGSHHIPTENEYKIILGKYYDIYRPYTYSHQAKDENNLVYVGTTSYNTILYFNRLLIEARNVLVIGSVEPHYFAGYTGGRKAFLPGVAGYNSIEQNHSYALSSNALPLALENNPIHKDMEEALEFLKDKSIFAIMTILEKNHKIYAITTGDIRGSFYAALKKADEIYTVSVPAKAEIVISAAPYPLNRDLYQSQKAIENTKMVLKDEGIFILVSSCDEGVGPDTFVKLMQKYKTPEKLLKIIKQEYKLGYHKVVKLVELIQRVSLWGITEVSEEIMRSVYI